MNTIPERSAITKSFIDVLDKIPIGGFISYKQIEQDSGYVRNGNLSYLSSARKILLHEKNKLFECIRGQGLQLLDDRGIVRQAPTDGKRIHNIARRGRRKLEAVQKWEELSPQEKFQHNLHASIYAAIAIETTVRKIKKLGNEVFKAQIKLPYGRTLKALGDGEIPKE